MQLQIGRGAQSAVAAALPEDCPGLSPIIFSMFHFDDKSTHLSFLLQYPDVLNLVQTSLRIIVFDTNFCTQNRLE